MEWRSGRRGCKTCPWLAMIRLKRISSASSVRSLYVGTSLLQYSSLLHRLTNDSSLWQSAAEHAPRWWSGACSSADRHITTNWRSKMFYFAEAIRRQLITIHKGCFQLTTDPRLFEQQLQWSLVIEQISEMQKLLTFCGHNESHKSPNKRRMHY